MITKIKFLAKFGIYICICKFFFVTLPLILYACVYVHTYAHENLTKIMGANHKEYGKTN